MEEDGLVRWKIGFGWEGCGLNLMSVCGSGENVTDACIVVVGCF